MAEVLFDNCLFGLIAAGNFICPGQHNKPQSTVGIDHFVCHHLLTFIGEDLLSRIGLIEYQTSHLFQNDIALRKKHILFALLTLVNLLHLLLEHGLVPQLVAQLDPLLSTQEIPVFDKNPGQPGITEDELQYYCLVVWGLLYFLLVQGDGCFEQVLGDFYVLFVAQQNLGLVMIEIGQLGGQGLGLQQGHHLQGLLDALVCEKDIPLLQVVQGKLVFYVCCRSDSSVVVDAGQLAQLVEQLHLCIRLDRGLGDQRSELVHIFWHHIGLQLGFLWFLEEVFPEGQQSFTVESSHPIAHSLKKQHHHGATIISLFQSHWLLKYDWKTAGKMIFRGHHPTTAKNVPIFSQSSNADNSGLIIGCRLQIQKIDFYTAQPRTRPAFILTIISNKLQSNFAPCLHLAYLSSELSSLGWEVFIQVSRVSNERYKIDGLKKNKKRVM